MKRLCLMLSGLALAPLTYAQTPLEALHSAASFDAPTYSYNLNIDDGETKIVANVDPSAPMGERLTVTSPAQDDWSKELRKYAESLRKNTKGNIWCQQFTELVPTDAALISETDTTARYTFQPSPTNEKDGLGKIAKHLQGFVTLDKATGNIQELEMTAPKPFKPVVVAKINTFQMKTTCALAPNGHMHIKRIDTVVKGKAMTKAFDQSETQTITNLQALTPHP